MDDELVPVKGYDADCEGGGEGEDSYSYSAQFQSINIIPIRKYCNLTNIIPIHNYFSKYS